MKILIKEKKFLEAFISRKIILRYYINYMIYLKDLIALFEKQQLIS